MTVLQFPRRPLRWTYTLHDAIVWGYGLHYPGILREWLSSDDYAYGGRSRDGRRHLRVGGVYQYDDDGRHVWEPWA